MRSWRSPLGFDIPTSMARSSAPHQARVISRPSAMPRSLPRAYLVAGTLEPFFLQNAKRWAAALSDAGADVVMRERIGSHGDAFWQEEFPLMVAVPPTVTSAFTGWPTRRSDSTSTHRDSTPTGSRHTRRSSSTTSVDGCRRGSEQHYRPNERLFSECPQVRSWRSLLGFDIPTSMARSSAPHQARVISRPRRCRVRFRAHTSSQARWSRSSCRTRSDGPSR